MLFWVLLIGSFSLGVGLFWGNGQCGGVITVDSFGSGYITSPRFPNDYPNNQHCVWDITAPPQHRITFEFEYFQVQREMFWRSIPPECHLDYVVVISVLSNGTEVVNVKYCTPSFLFPTISKENRMKVLFISDDSVTTKGFKAFYKVIPYTTEAPEETSTETITTASSELTTNVITTTSIPESVAETDTVTTGTDTVPTVTPTALDIDIHKRFESSKNRNIQWLLKIMKRRSTSELPRLTLVLFLAEPKFFVDGNQTSTELKDKLTIHILAQISRNATIQNQDLALYVQALLVLCQDPHDFFGHDLVSELRSRVDKPSKYSNPFEILALCNAGGNVSTEDVDRVSVAFNAKHRPFWAGVQAVATMAMQCLSSKVAVRDGIIKAMEEELKKYRLQDMTVGNIDTTALVVQALSQHGSSDELFDLSSALEGLLRAQGADGSWGRSIRKSFYVLPAISSKSLLDINNGHCPKITDREKDSLNGLHETVGSKKVVKYSVWMGQDVDVGCTWKVRVPANRNTTLYDLIEMVSKRDSRHNVSYQTVDEKPYVKALLGKEDDPELGIFWFTYIRLDELPPKRLERSPVDVLVNTSMEFIMWYKPVMET